MHTETPINLNLNIFYLKEPSSLKKVRQFWRLNR